MISTPTDPWAWVIVGAGIGSLIRGLMPSRRADGLVTTAAIGMIGAMGGGFLAVLLGGYGEGRPEIAVLAALGGLVLSVGYRMVAYDNGGRWRDGP